MTTDFETMLHQAERRAVNEAAQRKSNSTTGLTSVALDGQATAVRPASCESVADGPVPKTAGDLQNASKGTSAGWSLREAWSLLWPHVQPIAAFGGVVGYTAAWWALQAGVVAAIGHAVVGYAAVFIALRTVGQKLTRRLRISGIAAVTWIVLALATGPSLLMIVTAWVMMLALAAGYWRAIRPGYPTDAPVLADPEPAFEPEPVKPTGLAADWDTFATPLFPKSWLEYVGSTEYTNDFTLHLKRGEQTPSMVHANLERICGALDLMPQKLILEAERGENASPSRMSLKHVHNSPVYNTLEYTGPRFNNGIIELGPYGDGQGWAPVRLYTSGGMWSTFKVGETGVGKSRVDEAFVIAAVSDPINYPTVVFYTDPQDGVSSPALQDYALGYTDAAETRSLAKAVARIAAARQLEAGAEGITAFKPQPCTCGTNDAERIYAMEHCEHREGCPYKPGILWVIDECHRVFEDEWIAHTFGNFTRELRKLGYGFLASSQSSDLGQFGGNRTLRKSLITGNAIAMKTADKITSDLLGFDADPTQLPPDPGYFYTHLTVPGSRQAFARCCAPVNPDDPTVNDAGTWLSRYPRLDLPPVEKMVAGEWLDSRASTSTEDAREEKRREVIRLRSGDPEALKRIRDRADARLGLSTESSKEEPTRRILPSQGVSPDQAIANAVTVPGYEELIREINEFLDSAPADTNSPASPVGERRDISDSRSRRASAERVYDLLAGSSGPVRMRDLEQKTGWSGTHLRGLLSDLERHGRVRKVAHGQWSTANSTTEGADQ